MSVKTDCGRVVCQQEQKVSVFKAKVYVNYRKETLEKFVLDSIITELKKSHQIERIIKGLLALQEAQIKASSTLSILEKEQKQNETAMENIMSAVERGFYTASANRRMRIQHKAPLAHAPGEIPSTSHHRTKKALRLECLFCGEPISN